MKYMKRALSFILATVMVLSFTVCSSMAITNQEVASELPQHSDVHIPQGTSYVTEGNETIFYDFYDDISNMHYAFYNSKTGEHFAMSGPQYEYIDSNDVGVNVRATRKVAHNYSFSGRYEINGKNNGYTFELPADTIFILGSAETRMMATDDITTDEYEDGYNYTVKVCQDSFLFPQQETFATKAGESLYKDFEAKNGTYYLVIIPNDRLNDGDYLKGSGKLYYYE